MDYSPISLKYQYFSAGSMTNFIRFFMNSMLEWGQTADINIINRNKRNKYERI